MTICQHDRDMSHPTTDAHEFARQLRAAGFDKGTASKLASGVRPIGPRVAAKIWSKLRLKTGPIADATDEFADAFAETMTQ